MIEEGKKAPAFTLPSSEGGTVSLKDLKGKTIVLYFYPKDDTPGCTREACDFRDTQAPIRKAGAVVFGVSGDALESHGKFKTKYKLNFPLLSDAANEVATNFGAYGEKRSTAGSSWASSGPLSSSTAMAWSGRSSRK